MGTKLQELRNGCFARAMDDEPMFVLLARDPRATELVRHWADLREDDVRKGRRPASDMGQVQEARDTARRMEAWRASNDGSWKVGLFGKDAATNATLEREGEANRLFDVRHGVPEGGRYDTGTTQDHKEREHGGPDGYGTDGQGGR